MPLFNWLPFVCYMCRDMIDGMRMDLVKSRYDNYDELYEYCYRVAGTVALMSMPVMGVDPAYKVGINVCSHAASSSIWHDSAFKRRRGSSAAEEGVSQPIVPTCRPAVSSCYSALLWGMHNLLVLQHLVYACTEKAHNLCCFVLRCVLYCRVPWNQCTVLRWH